jgi:hypothetical protein
MLKKLPKKKFAPVLHPLTKFFSFGLPNGKELPLGDQMEKTSFEGPKEIKNKFKPLEEPFFLLVPQSKDSYRNGRNTPH